MKVNNKYAHYYATDSNNEKSPTATKLVRLAQ